MLKYLSYYTNSTGFGNRKTHHKTKRKLQIKTYNDFKDKWVLQMKTYNNFNEMFSSNSNTTCSVFNDYTEFQQIPYGNDNNAYHGFLVKDVWHNNYTTACYIYDSSYADSYNNYGYNETDGSCLVVIPTRQSMQETINGEVLGEFALEYAAKKINSLPNIEITSNSSTTGIRCSRPLTNKEAQRVAKFVDDKLFKAYLAERDAQIEQGIYPYH